MSRAIPLQATVRVTSKGIAGMTGATEYQPGDYADATDWPKTTVSVWIAEGRIVPVHQAPADVAEAQRLRDRVSRPSAQTPDPVRVLDPTPETEIEAIGSRVVAAVRAFLADGRITLTSPAPEVHLYYSVLNALKANVGRWKRSENDVEQAWAAVRKDYFQC